MRAFYKPLFSCCQVFFVYKGSYFEPVMFCSKCIKKRPVSSDTKRENRLFFFLKARYERGKRLIQEVIAEHEDDR